MDGRNHKTVLEEPTTNTDSQLPFYTIDKKKLFKAYCKMIKNAFSKKDIQKIINELVLYVNDEK